MKQPILALSILIFLTSCLETKKDSFRVQIISDGNGKVSEVDIIRNPVDNNYIQLMVFPDGEIKSLKEFKNGKENGKDFMWRDTGRLIFEAYKTNDKFDRVTREVNKNGRTSFEGQRVNTKFEGTINSFYESGAIRQRMTRVNDKDLGHSIKYYENGLIKEIGEYTEAGYTVTETYNENGEKIN